MFVSHRILFLLLISSKNCEMFAVKHFVLLYTPQLKSEAEISRLKTILILNIIVKHCFLHECDSVIHACVKCIECYLV